MLVYHCPDRSRNSNRLYILTTQIIEIKNITHWKSALGQILSYGSFYPEHQKILYLFNKTESKIDTIQIENICKKYQIEVRYDN
jgi:hypothetical protein